MARIALATLIGALGAIQAVTPTHAGGTDPVQAAISAGGGAYAGCLSALAYRESTDNPEAVNPISGAYGPWQFLPHSGVWDQTPEGRSGLPVTAASLVQQAAAVVWAISHGYGSAWSTLPAECG